MPLGLTRNTWPLADRLPRMDEASPPVTRLSTTDELEGWANCTLAPAPMEKPCQLMMARSLVWVMRCWPGATVAMVAEPAATLPPVGSAPAVCATAPSCSATATATVKARRTKGTRRMLNLYPGRAWLTRQKYALRG